VVLSLHDGDALGLDQVKLAFDGVVTKHLVRALSDLSLPVKHEAPSENVNFILVWNGSVPTSPDDSIGRLVVDLVPLMVIPSKSELGDLVVTIVI